MVFCGHSEGSAPLGLTSVEHLPPSPSHKVNKQVDLEAGTRKKFNELFGSFPSLATQVGSEYVAPEGKNEVPTLDFPLGFVPHGTRSDDRILKVPKVLINTGSNEWVTTLVGYFIGKGLPYSLVTSATEWL